MATNWIILQQQFLKEHSLSGISVKAWCEKEKINHATARRRIKINAQSVEYKLRNQENVQNVQTAQKTYSAKSNKNINQSLKASGIERERNKATIKNAISKKRTASLTNQNARTFGHYSEFITTDEDAERYASASTTKLDDELNLMRMQLSNLMVAIKITETDLRSDVSVKQKIQLHESYEKYQTAASVKVARIESLENSIIRNEKTRVDIEKTIVMTEKAQLEADKLRSESNILNTPLQQMYDEILALDNDGMMNTNHPDTEF